MGRTNAVANHPQVSRINAMLDDGVTYAEIARAVGGTSVPAIGRYALSRKSDLAKVAEHEPSTTDVILRAVQIADDARDLRQKSRTGTPVARARAIKVESEALSVLINHLGIDDLGAEGVFHEVAALIEALGEHAKQDPDATRSLLRTMAGHPALADLRAALRRQIGNQTA